MSRVRESHHSPAGGRRLLGDWGVALLIAAALVVYGWRHATLLVAPLRRLLELLP